MGIHVIQSQRLDILLQGVLHTTQQQSTDPFAILASQHIVAPSTAIQEWLTLRLSEAQGISANSIFHQRIRGLQWYLYQQVLTDKERVRKANIPSLVLKWRIYQVLLEQFQQYAKQNAKQTEKQTSSSAQASNPHPLSSLLQRVIDNGKALPSAKQQRQRQHAMLYWIAEQLAQLFTHYMVYRGECQADCPTGQCRCRGNWLAAWSRDQALNVEQLLNVSEHADAAYQLEQAQQLEAWQRWLWQQGFAQDFAEILAVDQAFWATLDDPQQRNDALAQLPAQVVVFTLLELPPNQLKFLRRLGQYIDVYILHYNPSQEYWADSVDPLWKKQYDLGVKQRYLQQHPQASAAELAAFFQDFTLNFNALVRESRHPLLTRFGKQARDHFSLLAQLSAGVEGQWVDAFVQFPITNLLSKIQSDILNLTEPEAGAYLLATDDQSIQIHVCHSTLRQLEVLKEQLLHWLAQGTAEQPRRPSDIVVMVPQLASLEALIRSVFPQQVQKDGIYLPVKIAGISSLDAQHAWRAVLGRFCWVEQRFNIEEFTDWLQLAATQQYYALDSDATARILVLLQQAGFRRGLDAEHLQLSLDASDQDYRYSFQFALNRLVMGIAIPERVVCNEILSFEQVYQDDFALIDILIRIYQDFSTRRNALHAHLQAEHMPDVEYWLRYLLEEVEAFEQAGVTALAPIKEILHKQQRMLTLAQFYAQDQQGLTRTFQLPLSDVLMEVEKALLHQADQVLPTGQITFCEIGQIRPIPYQLVVLLDLDAGVFPNRQQHTAFDLMDLLKAQLGDRSRLEDDQGAFLDALLLAEQGLWLFYNGFDVNDAEARDPSSVLQELIQHFSLICAMPEATPADVIPTDAMIEKDGIVIAANIQQLYQVHPLQPFDPNGFIQQQPVRFQDHWYQVAAQLQKLRGVQRQIYWNDVAAPIVLNETASYIDARQWIQAMCFPVQWYLQQLGVQNPSAMTVLPEQEPLLLDGLGRYALRDFMVQHQQPEALALPLLQDQLPVGKIQHSAWQMSQAEHSLLMQRLQRYGAAPTQTTPRYWQASPTYRFQIELPAAGQSTWLSLDAASARGKRRAKVWLEYLFWLAASDLAADQGTDWQRIAVFSDVTLQCCGLSQQQAQAYLQQWLAASTQAAQQVLVLPAALLLSAAEKNKALHWQQDAQGHWQLAEWDDLRKQWQGDQAHFGAGPAAEDNEACRLHRDWQFVLQEQDSTALLDAACQQYSYALYAPIYQHQRVIEE
ncbi:exodeoxyribonuclease V subunit gamma [Acinetobacter larvae]|uniref:RecBCD enzyme subunit RecC n=1 Tax=Acinetobacter larvae TaxID=1789224 RepID=A0A1B2LW53_9GAMM|nr:exodeoxyribonuclease V subunit gamma [Acinetobacter larvae]AOA57170.1 exonuclease V subunit gamma [Acinetobacter larvae]